MKKNLFAAAGLLLVCTVFLAACKKDAGRQIDSAFLSEETAAPLAQVTLRIKGSPQTKANDDRPLISGNEDKLNTVEVFVFDRRDNSATFGMLEAYKKADASEISDGSATVTFNTSIGKKHIYVVANSGRNAASSSTASLAESIFDEDDLLGAVSEFSGNASSRFIMVGSVENASHSTEPELSEGKADANNLTCQLRRIVARIKVDEIVADFTSPALRKSTFKVNRIYLMNMSKQAKYFNGRWEDVFGVDATSGQNQGSAISDAASFPVIGNAAFKPASTVGKFYVYALPASNGSAANGYFNWMDPASFSPATGVTLSLPETDAFSCVKFTSGNTLFPSAGDGNRMEPKHCFYAYPNAAVPATSQSGVDLTTKVVIETEIEIDGTSQRMYYPISIPYIQPNYAYEIGKVTIKRLGSSDPFHPVTTAECSFVITVKDWDTGDIQGQFNNESTADGENDQFII